jgi:peptidoglycan/xylan/chitin deacetylase (PgdA/CDA1 family)
MPEQGGDAMICAPATVVPPVSVLAYHNIVGWGQESPHDTYSIPIDRLQEHLAALAEAGFVQMTLADAFDVLRNSRDHLPSYVVTFDDGYLSLHRYADQIPVAIAPTVFILSRYAGQSTLSWNTRSSVVLEHLDPPRLRELQQGGFDIQAHGTDHHNLLKFTDDQLRARFREIHEWFRAHLGKRPDYLAYPYGFCDQRVRTVVSEFFQGAVSMNHGAWTGPESRYALNRIGVPWYLGGRDVVELVRMPPAVRWYETERRAPWRIAKRD